MRYIKIFLSVILGVAGCHGTSETPNYDDTTGAGAGTTATGGSAGAGTGGNTTTGVDGAAPIPFAVDSYYVPSGFMGDGETPGGLVDDASCPVRAGEEKGLCHHLTWKPGAKGWAGVYWQYPDGNWGTAEGREISPGATRISFWAWGKNGGEKVAFFAGIQEADGFHVESGDIVLTTEPTQYFIQIGGAVYDKVVGGFGWSSGTSDGATPVVFHVDDVQWQKAEDPGCTNKEATNYDPNAVADDGSCLLPVTFEVDLAAVTLAPTDIVHVQSTFNQWCGVCNPMADADKDGVWSVTLPLAAGTYEYKYTTNGWDGQVEDVPLACDVTGGMFENRGFTVADKAVTLPLHAWSECP